MYNYFNFGYQPINESRSLIDGNTEWILSLGSIKIMDAKTKELVEVPCRDFTKLVDMALGRIESKYPYISAYIMHSKIMYVPYSDGMHDTMAVDSGKNLWINMPFVYNVLNMDVDRIYGILFHELMHNVLGHLDKIAAKFPVAKRLAMGEAAWELESKKINICTDMEVNCDMVADEIVAPSFWEKIMKGCVYDKSYTGKMWEQIYNSDGDKLFKEYAAPGEMGEKMAEVLKAFEEYAEKISDPDMTERDKAKAKEELDKKLEEILGKDPSKKDKTKTIKKALERLKSSYLQKIGNFREILDELIDIYLINPEKFNDEDYNRAIDEINKFEKELIENVTAICSESMHLEETPFKDYTVKTMEMFRGNTKKVFEGRTTLPPYEIARLNLDVAEALWVLLEDEDAKESVKKEREKREEDEKKKKEEARRKKEKKEKEEKRKRHILFQLFRKLANIANLVEVDRVSEETYNVAASIARGIQKLFDVPVIDLKYKDVKDFVDACPELGELLAKDLMNLYDNHTILTKTSTELEKIAKSAAQSVSDALTKVVDSSIDLSEKRNAIVDAIDKLNEVGRLLRTKKKTKPSEEFKEAYKEEMKRLTKVAKELGKDVIKEHLKELGFGPGTFEPGFGGDVVGTRLDPFKKRVKTTDEEDIEINI